jgi:hypothetical protein
MVVSSGLSPLTSADRLPRADQAKGAGVEATEKVVPFLC